MEAPRLRRCLGAVGSLRQSAYSSREPTSAARSSIGVGLEDSGADHRQLRATAACQQPLAKDVSIYTESLWYLHVYLYHIVIHLLSNIIYYWLRWVCRGRHLTGPPDLNAGGKI